MSERLPLLPTMGVVSYASPGWFIFVRQQARDGALGAGDLEELFDDATRIAIDDQLDAERYLTLLDRKKDLILSSAENVYSVEVENALARHPAVEEAAVIGVPDAQWGERVQAVVVLRNGSAITADALQTHCRALIGGYKIPRTIEFVDALPRSAAGKVQKERLRAPYWRGSARRIN
jgi:acyl-CoA synthetase (AMP-forming)/AMP-acid ligase II